MTNGENDKRENLLRRGPVVSVAMVTVSGDEQSDLDMDTRSVSSISNESDIDSGLHVSNGKIRKR